MSDSGRVIGQANPHHPNYEPDRDTKEKPDDWPEFPKGITLPELLAQNERLRQALAALTRDAEEVVAYLQRRADWYASLDAQLTAELDLKADSAVTGLDIRAMLLRRAIERAKEASKS